jgi:hypothetical protein
MKTERKTKAASLSSDLATWAEEQAKKENRSFSNYIETLLARAKATSTPPATKQREPEGLAA